MGDHPAILAEGVVKRFGRFTALSGVDVAVPAGTVLGLLGPNGAGKTTLVRILTTLLPPDGGRAWVLGHDVVDQVAAVRRVIGLSGQYAAVDAYLTGRENLRMIGRLAGLDRSSARRRSDELLDQFDLHSGADRMTRTYSGGMRRRLDVAASLVGHPEVLFLDEPTTGLDPRGRAALWRLVAQLTGDGATVLLTTQYLEEADRLADSIVVLDRGAVIATGTVEQLKAQVGGDRLELRAPPGTDLQALATAMADLGTDEPTVDIDERRVVVPVRNSSAVLPECAARLARTGLQVSDLALRRPTLDDVFLSITGRSTAPTSEPAEAGRPR